MHRDGPPLDLFYAAFRRVDWIEEHKTRFSEQMLRAWLQRLHGGQCAFGMRRLALDEIDSLPLPWLVRALREIPGDLHTMAPGGGHYFSSIMRARVPRANA